MSRLGASASRDRRFDRAAIELVGVCRGILADGHVCQMEAEFLKGWIERSAPSLDEYPFSYIYEFLARILEDGVIDDGESSELHGLLVRFVGGEVFDPRLNISSVSTALPLDDPPPALIFKGKTFVFTGVFDFGSRSDVVVKTVALGGSVVDDPSKNVDYVVIGSFGSRDWLTSSAGTKIMKAVELRAGGAPLAVVSEAHWVSSFSRTT